MNSFMPNIRWLAIPSDDLGHDWYAKSLVIDSFLGPQGLDLESEKCYLLYDSAPLKVLQGEGQCLIARPVIGPKKEQEAPLQLIDWTAAPVWQKSLNGVTLEEIFSECTELQRSLPETVQEKFMLVIDRKLNPDLKVSVNVIFQQ